MERLQKVAVMYPWGFIFTAMETLQILWGLQGNANSSRSWLQTLKDPAMNFLLV